MRKVFQKRVRHSGDGVNIVADINAVVVANTGKNGAGGASASRRQSFHVVQKDGHTEVTETDERGDT